MSDLVLRVTLHVDEGEEEQMARDIRRVLASRKALKRLLNAVTTISVADPGEVPVMPRRRGQRCGKPVTSNLVCIQASGHSGPCQYVGAAG